MATLRQEVIAVREDLAQKDKLTEELRKVVEETSSQVESLQVAYSKAQEDLEALRDVALAVCKEVEGPEVLVSQSGSSVASRLRALGGCGAERLKGALRLGVQKTLGVISMHFVVDLNAVSAGYVVADDLDDAAALAVVESADAGASASPAALAQIFESDLLPDATPEGPEDPAP